MRRGWIALVVAMGWTVGDATAEPVGFFSKLRGDVQVEAGLGAWQAAVQDGPLEMGDRIRTAEGAHAEIVLVDDTVLKIDEDTEIRIESFHVGAAATRDRSILRQTRGRLRTTVGHAFGGETRLEVHTPTAVVGVKGTDFETTDMSTDQKVEWKTCLHSGAILLSNEHGSSRPPAGYCCMVEAGQPPGEVFPNPDAPLEITAAVSDDFDDRIAYEPEATRQVPGIERADDDDLRQFPEVELPGSDPAPAPAAIAPPPVIVGPIP